MHGLQAGVETPQLHQQAARSEAPIPGNIIKMPDVDGGGLSIPSNLDQSFHATTEAGNFLTTITHIFCAAVTNLDLENPASKPAFIKDLGTWIEAAQQHQQRVSQALVLIEAAAAVESEVLDAFETVTKIWTNHAQLCTMTLVMVQTKLTARREDDGGRAFTGFVHGSRGLVAEAAGMEGNTTDFIVPSLAVLARVIGWWREDLEDSREDPKGGREG
ncbi:hypothetical protein GE09DRAFT_318053 [Coniochaeta sp. 2T2.1]|nr:hypothetical protein GE09DRAFT_318053 [Coniochaeta sp. 2T2.1]